MTNPQKVNAYTLLAAVALVCATVAAIEVPTERWEKLGHFLTDPATAVAVTALGAAVAAFLGRLRHSPAPALLAAFLAAATLTGCGAQLTDSQRAALAVETQVCIVNERDIVARRGTTAEEDRAALEAERARCDAARAAIVEGR